MKKVRSLFGAAILALVSLPVSAGLITYNNYVDWEKAVSGDIITESFGSDILGGTDITFEGGVESSASAANLLINEVDAPSYEGRVGLGTNFSENITWTFPDTLVSGTLGFFVQIRDVGSANSLEVVVGGLTTKVSNGNGGGGDFGFGITSDFLFSSFSWKFGTETGEDNDFFRIDEFSYVEPASAVPAPPALLLFGTGLLGLIGFKRRRKAA